MDAERWPTSSSRHWTCFQIRPFVRQDEDENLSQGMMAWGPDKLMSVAYLMIVYTRCNRLSKRLWNPLDNLSQRAVVGNFQTKTKTDLTTPAPYHYLNGDMAQYHPETRRKCHGFTINDQCIKKYWVRSGIELPTCSILSVPLLEQFCRHACTGQ